MSRPTLKNMVPSPYRRTGMLRRRLRRSVSVRMRGVIEEFAVKQRSLNGEEIAGGAEQVVGGLDHRGQLHAALFRVER